MLRWEVENHCLRNAVYFISSFAVHKVTRCLKSWHFQKARYNPIAWVAKQRLASRMQLFPHLHAAL